MKPKIIFCTAIVIFTSSFLLAQKPVFYKTLSFAKHETRANVFVDENFNAADDGQATRYLVYAEMAQQKNHRLPQHGLTERLTK